MTNYKGVFKQIDLEKIDCYSLEKDEESFVINLNNIFHIEFIEFEILDKFDIKIYFSGDKITWIEKKEEHLLVDFSKFSLTYSDKEKYQYIKINTKINNIKDEKINIFVRKFPGLMVAARSDGFGARFMPILNAMYLAEYAGFKFGFVWKKSGHDENSLKKFENNELAGLHLSNESNIFSKDFISQYSYTNKLPSNMQVETKNSINEFINNTNYFWGNYVDYNITRKFFGARVFEKYPKLWKKIKFSTAIQKIIDNANKIASVVFPKKFIAIHIRSGDIVYDERVKKLGVGIGKAMPIEIAMHLIEENLTKNEKIVLFGDDFTSLRELKKQYGVSIIEDFIDENLSGIERIVFEIVFMSNAKDIFSGGSSFAKVAAYIGLGKEPKFYTVLFSNEQQLNILQKYDNTTFHNLQKAHSLYYGSVLLFRTGANIELILSNLKQASILDKTNCLYELLIIYMCLRSRMYLEIERILKNSIFKCEDYLENFHYGIYHLDIKKTIAKIPIDNINRFPRLLNFIRFIQSNFYQILLDYKDEVLVDLRKNIVTIVKEKNNIIEEKNRIIYSDMIKSNQIQSKLSFQFKYGTAKSRIQNQLSYKLGQAMIVNSKSILGYIRMPFVLSYIKDKHKQEQKIYQEKIKKDPSLKLPLLESYPDYQEALKFKNHLSYKLGEALIQANKTWYKGGYVKMLFEIGKLKQKIKKENNGN
ncbi:hypothetical protein ACYQE6_000385 [Campylobacter coli]|uniref:hypothetical protein n=1 Tax=Campylobacter coli TaxID=195 RepID=UPI00077674BB|nr:hypothetical protein [Campylobacter coli]KXU23174.1 hypothetical protein AOB50_03885 [Campylobacter coli]MCV3390388.1 hypothetical protein [Campylobacter lari]MCV3401469.1 hypothetical protein [Campylobacter lari]MCV3412053.1 hypothetical protein [Campylobacter lari]